MGDRTADRAWIEQNVCSVSQCKGDWISVDDLVLINLLLHSLFILFFYFWMLAMATLLLLLSLVLNYIYMTNHADGCSSSVLPLLREPEWLSFL